MPSAVGGRTVRPSPVTRRPATSSIAAHRSVATAMPWPTALTTFRPSALPGGLFRDGRLELESDMSSAEYGDLHASRCRRHGRRACQSASACSRDRTRAVCRLRRPERRCPIDRCATGPYSRRSPLARARMASASPTPARVRARSDRPRGAGDRHVSTGRCSRRSDATARPTPSRQRLHIGITGTPAAARPRPHAAPRDHSRARRLCPRPWRFSRTAPGSGGTRQLRRRPPEVDMGAGGQRAPTGRPGQVGSRRRPMRRARDSPPAGARHVREGPPRFEPTTSRMPGSGRGGLRRSS
jgi:hypothetical protein